MNLQVPTGMTRRHFLNHALTTAAAVPALDFLLHLQANAATVRRNQKACILLWLGGGPPTIDMWDLKPGSKNGGEFKPIATSGSFQICEHMPKVAKIASKLSIVRSMSTREADHGRGRYYLHTSYVPNPTVIHPSFGSIVSRELGPKRPWLEIPAFISVGGASEGPGFLGMANAPFVVDAGGGIRNAQNEKIDIERFHHRMTMLDVVETGFINSKRGDAPQAHKDIYKKAVNLMTSRQMAAFRIKEERPEILTAYGANNFGRGLVMARRLVEIGVPFVEVTLDGWDLHQRVFDGLKTRLLPSLDQGLSALVNDLSSRGMLEHTVIVCMGEFGRTPRINQDVGRDHWAQSWSVVMTGGGLNSGRVIGGTDKEGVAVDGKSYLPGDVWATVAHALGIPLNTVYTSKLGRPMKVVNGGTPIQELIS
ncbi:MAG TPA: DUF1501 domain-containing protein [Planctomycetaceae bacterium]|nr:DUF1501 domain-containing protein [Planctomycetaceae bacterium]